MRFSAFVLTLLAVIALSAAPRAQSGLTGNWTLSFNTPQGAQDAAATIKVDGDKLSGTLSSPAGEVPFTGTTKGKTFTFSFEIQTPQGNISIAIAGEQDGDAVKGTFDFGQGTGDFTGARKK